MFYVNIYNVLFLGALLKKKQEETYYSYNNLRQKKTERKTHKTYSLLKKRKDRGKMELERN